MSSKANVPRLVESFFTDRLQRHRQASVHTIAAYRDTFRLLLAFAQRRLKKAPSALSLDDLDAPFVGAFLEHLQKERGNSARTRNARLAAVHSFFRYAALHEPGHSSVIQRVLAIPSKRYERKLVGFLTRDELDALLAAPDRHTWDGRRDYALLLLFIETGLRVSELVGLPQRPHAFFGSAFAPCFFALAFGFVACAIASPRSPETTSGGFGRA